MRPARYGRGLRRLAGALCGLAALLAAVGAVLVAADRHLPTTTDYGTAYGGLALSPALLTFAGMGVLVVRHQPRHTIGWLLIVAGVAVEATGVLDEYVRFSHARAGGSVWRGAGATGDRFAVLFVASVMVAVPLLFPSGRLLSPRWRPVLWATAAGTAAGLVRPDLIVLLLPCGATALASVGLRYLRSSAVERLQIRWVLLAISVTLLSLVSVAVTGHGLGTPTPGWFRVVADASGVLIALIPIAMGIAVLRYRLYDIDRLVSRTLTYATVTTGLAVLYAVGVTALGRVGPAGNGLSVAATTLVVAALFQPLRRRVQSAVDRRFNRAAYDADRTMDDFRRRLREEVDLAAVRTDLLQVVHGTVQPSAVGLWLRDGL